MDAQPPARTLKPDIFEARLISIVFSTKIGPRKKIKPVAVADHFQSILIIIENYNFRNFNVLILTNS